MRRQTRRQTGGVWRDPRTWLGQSAKNKEIAELRAQLAAAKVVPVTNLTGVSPIARVETKPPTGDDLTFGAADRPKQGFFSNFKLPTIFKRNTRSNEAKLKSMIEDRQARNRLTFATKDKNYRIVGTDGKIEGEADWQDTGKAVPILKDNRRGQYRNSTIYDYPETSENIYKDFTNKDGVVDLQKFTNTKKEKPVRVRVYYPSTNISNIERMERVVKNQVTREKLKTYKAGYETKYAQDKIKWNAIDTAIQNAKTTTLANLNNLYTEYSNEIAATIKKGKELDTKRIDNKVKTIQDAQFKNFQQTGHIYKPPKLTEPTKGDATLDEEPFTSVKGAISQVLQNKKLDPVNTVYDNDGLNAKLGEIIAAGAPPATSVFNRFLGRQAQPVAPVPAAGSAAGSGAAPPAAPLANGSAAGSGAAPPAAPPANGSAGSGAAPPAAPPANGSAGSGAAPPANGSAGSGSNSPKSNRAGNNAAEKNAAAAAAAAARGQGGGRRTRRRKNRSRR